MKVKLNCSPDNQFSIYMGLSHWEIISDRDKDLILPRHRSWYNEVQNRTDMAKKFKGSISFFIGFV
jgi:hypothetical protein